MSRGCLLIRSPKQNDYSQNVDIKFYGTEFVCVSRHLDEICLEEANERDVSEVQKILGTRALDKKIFVIKSGKNRHRIVAVQMQIELNDLAMLESPFDR